MLMRNLVEFWRRLVTVALQNRMSSRQWTEAAEGGSMDRKGHAVDFLGYSIHGLNKETGKTFN